MRRTGRGSPAAGGPAHARGTLPGRSHGHGWGHRVDKTLLITRLQVADPDWPEWEELIQLVESRAFELVDDEFLGAWLVSDSPLSFSVSARVPWPEWMPPYVPALYGMKADTYQMAGGYAFAFSGATTERNAVFTSGDDDDLGFPVFDPPPDVYPFQENESGALFHINKELDMLYPHMKSASLKVLDLRGEYGRETTFQVLNYQVVGLSPRHV